MPIFSHDTHGHKWVQLCSASAVAFHVCTVSVLLVTRFFLSITVVIWVINKRLIMIMVDNGPRKMKECLLHYVVLPLFYNILFLFLLPLLFFIFIFAFISYPVSCLLFFFSCLISTLLSTSSQVWLLPPNLSLFFFIVQITYLLLFFTILTSLPFCFFLLFFNLFFIFFASLPLHLSCGPNSPITAGGNYAWKVIRCSLNNYPLMQLIDFSFQELCFLSPGSAFLSPS